MATFQHVHDRVLVLMSAVTGITQAVIGLLEAPDESGQKTRLLSASNMFNAARVVGDALREIHQRDAEDLREHGYDFNGTFILGGQIKGEGAAPVPSLLRRQLHRILGRDSLFSDRRIQVRQTHNRPGDYPQQQLEPGRQVRAGVHGRDHPLESDGGAALGPGHHQARRIEAVDAYQHR